jgi:arylsulfatase A-like enzyme
VALNAPHTPILPSSEWSGKSGISPYADFVMQTDHSVGLMVDALDQAGLGSNTVVFVTSDNGCSPEANFPELAKVGHQPSAAFRGTKADLFEGGHRVPFIARWPERIPPGGSTPALICLVDMMATCAELAGERLPDNAGEDSVSLVASLAEAEKSAGRETLVSHSINGSFAIRKGDWKLLLSSGSGGWSEPRPNSAAARNLPDVQLYNLRSDVGEKNNVAARHPELVAELTQILENQVKLGRSTPGPAQTNTVAIQLRKPTR